MVFTWLVCYCNMGPDDLFSTPVLTKNFLWALREQLMKSNPTLRRVVLTHTPDKGGIFERSCVRVITILNNHDGMPMCSTICSQHLLLISYASCSEKSDERVRAPLACLYSVLNSAVSSHVLWKLDNHAP